MSQLIIPPILLTLNKKIFGKISNTERFLEGRKYFEQKKLKIQKRRKFTNSPSLTNKNLNLGQISK